MNVNAIDKIIAERSQRDYKARINKLTEKQIENIRTGKKRLSDYGGYTLGADTLEALDVKHDYLSGTITEAQYKAYCIKQVLMEV